MKLRTVLVCLSVMALPLQAAAEDARPRGTYVPYEPPPGVVIDETDVDTNPTKFESNIVYLNPCWGDCQLTGGWPDHAPSNKSSIIRNGSATISEYRWGQDSWDAVVDCVQEMYAEFNVEVTDQDPGDVTHFEAIVAGTPQEAGMGNGVGGVSPFSCGVIDNAITFSFANIYGGSVQAICEVVAQESAHAFGLDHEYLCEDPMTYLSGCGPKRFRDIDADCGEFEPRECQCGGQTQNSVQEILAIFGPAQPSPPTVEITDPTDGESVEPGFIVRADATDNVDVERAELWINGSMVTEIGNEPWVFNAPDGLAKGNVEIEVRAYDNRGDAGSDSIAVTLGDPCGGNSDCDSGEACVEGRCVPGPDQPGGLGDVCDTGDDCSSGLCANDGEDRHCVEPCTSSCPGGFDCLDTGSGGVCWPGDGGGGVCTVSDDDAGGTAVSFILAGFLGMLVIRRRRRG